VLGTLLVLYALHVQLNQGGFGRASRRIAGNPAPRGELVVGFIPVT
jgi:hypothetical protein